MDLFDYMRETKMESEAPLASRIRPRTLDEIVGQQHILAKDKLLYRAIKADKLSSVIFYGPPGTGKTTIAKVIAGTTSAAFTQINATVAGKKDMEEVVAEAKQRMGMYGKRTILFVDEIHRFNKGQQDYLLPFVEDGTLVLIGATTENPYFEVNGALLSRSVIFELKPLDQEDIRKLILRAVQDEQKGMGAYNAVIEEDALSFLAQLSGGDARHEVDFVLTFEEMAGIFDAKHVDLENMEEDPDGVSDASTDGRNFAVAGGVAQAVVDVIKRDHPEQEIKVANAEGLKECRQLLKLATLGKYPGYLLEGMACPGGCVAGAGTMQAIKKSQTAVGLYAKKANHQFSSETEYIKELDKLVD